MSDNRIEVDGKTKSYALVPLAIVNDTTLSLEARMVWIYLEGRSGIRSWSIHPYDIQRMCGFGDKVWRRVSKELTIRGYLTMSRTKNGTKFKFESNAEHLMFMRAPPLTVVDKAGDK